MCRRFIFAAFLSVLLQLIIGCAGTAPSGTRIDGEDVPQFAGVKIISLMLTNGKEIAFADDGGWYYKRYGNRTRVIVGKTAQGESVTIPSINVREAYVANADAEAENNGVFFPAFLVVGVVVAAIL